MDPFVQVLNNGAVKSRENVFIKGKADNIEIGRGVSSFSMEMAQEDYKSERNSYKKAEDPLSFQNLLEGRVVKVELVLAALKRREEEREFELEREQRERERRLDRWHQEDQETIGYLLGTTARVPGRDVFGDTRLAEHESRAMDLGAQVTSSNIGFDGLESLVSAAESEFAKQADEGSWATTADGGAKFTALPRDDGYEREGGFTCTEEELRHGHGSDGELSMQPSDCVKVDVLSSAVEEPGVTVDFCEQMNRGVVSQECFDCEGIYSLNEELMRELCGGIVEDSCEQATLDEDVVVEWIFFEGEDEEEVARAFTCAEEPDQSTLEPFEFHAEAVKQGVPYSQQTCKPDGLRETFSGESVLRRLNRSGVSELRLPYVASRALNREEATALFLLNGKGAGGANALGGLAAGCLRDISGQVELCVKVYDPGGVCDCSDIFVMESFRNFLHYAIIHILYLDILRLLVSNYTEERGRRWAVLQQDAAEGTRSFWISL